jgi:chromosome segregation protein
MRLERLEINGFKSFSDRSELAFDKGVTAIVGPNGCGKSNVADAITWVMGEQSAKSLRGERMEDVIFNGSDARKPTAAAEVRLRFSGVVKALTGPVLIEGHGNGHGHAGSGGSGPNGNGNGQALSPAEELIRSVAREVEVTRRLYRSGESEYLIDGQVCRLRDVHELLMDTGLGAKAYAIIEQGKIGLILSSRPIDRRQLIEEAAGITKYKSRRRTAELKLEAAQLNLTRIDDIVFEVEKQRAALKRQAAKARRYRKLGNELRRWEKVLFARKYRQLAGVIQDTRDRLSQARALESTAAVRVSALESDLGRLRLELAERENTATSNREATHACELAINRRQQLVAVDGEQLQALEARSVTVAAEVEALALRREPARLTLELRRTAAAAAAEERGRVAAAMAAESEAHALAHRDIEGLEADVEAARSEVFSAINAATALRHALDHAVTAQDRVAEALSKLDVEAGDVRVEAERAERNRAATVAALRQAQQAIEVTRLARAARDAELSNARVEHERQVRRARSHEHGLAGLEARLRSLEELDAARAGYGDAARAVLAQANGRVRHQGAVADYLEVNPGFERAVESCLGDLLQYVIVERGQDAAAGVGLVREQGAGRCGFLIAAAGGLAPSSSGAALEPPEGVAALWSVVRTHGPHGESIRRAVGDAWIADTYETAAAASALTTLPVVTMNGDLFRGPHLVTGGRRDEARGILETKREIHDLRERVAAARDELSRLAEETRHAEAAMAAAFDGIAALQAEQHELEKAAVAHEAQLQRALDEAARLAQKREQLARERRQAEDERDALLRRQHEAEAAIAKLQHDQRVADDRLTTAQQRLLEAREATEDLGRRAAETGASHAALVERAAALLAEVQRLEEAAAELEHRADALESERAAARSRIESLQAGIAAGERQLDEEVRALETWRESTRHADGAVAALRARTDEHESTLRAARGELESARSILSELEVERATAESDLSHLAASCGETVQATLGEVAAEVEELERIGAVVPADVLAVADEPEDSDGEPREPDEAAGEPVRSTPGGEPETPGTAATRFTPEEAIAALKAKIDRLGPVNMMAIEQFDELESRHAFLSTQRRDLVDSIAQTSEAIRRIDRTTRERFAEAFTAINDNFQVTFSTLFGGGRAGLALLDEHDPLECGIDIIAQPPGKRLQSVQLLSGGEKALTAIALMFALFRYKPSPFCLLDEIDAPLDDANIGRFIEMLKSMQQHTQFILITHNRKTMEIADRLYGVTMEEPGVSKLISVQLN